MKEFKIGKVVITTTLTDANTFVIIPTIAIYYCKETKNIAIAFVWLKFLLQIGNY